MDVQCGHADCVVNPEVRIVWADGIERVHSESHAWRILGFALPGEVVRIEREDER